METVLIVGCGYLGRRVAERLRGDARKVLATVRSVSSMQALHADGYALRLLDLDAATDFAPPEDAYRVLYLAPPPPHGSQDPRLARLLSALQGHPPQRIVYAGSSSVYGDRQGAWVDETAAVSPQSETATRRLHAETGLLRWCEEHRISAVVLRLAGIYGPQRLPLERLRSGRPVVRESEAGWSNRIHVDDLAQACVSALRHPSPQTIYNVADGHPASTTAFLRAVAERARLPMPAEVALSDALAHASPAQARFLRESRRLEVSRMRRDLLCTPRFVDFRAGLDAIADFE